MSGNGSADEQSEDGELQQSPVETKSKQEIADISASEEEGENVDALDIKPPQARMSSLSRNKRRDQERGHHKRTDRHRSERHSHRDKHLRNHCIQQRIGNIIKEPKKRYYSEKQSFEQVTYEVQYDRNYRGRKEESSSRSRHSDSRKHDEKKSKELRDSRYGRDAEKHKREHYEDEKRNRVDKALHDLRERLLSKRNEEGYSKAERSSHRERKYRDHNNEDPLQGEAGMYVKEIINITTEEKKYRKDKDKVSEEDKAEQEQRRDKLLEAEREMARLKEQTRVEENDVEKRQQKENMKKKNRMKKNACGKRRTSRNSF
ncbi:hypothetical protein NQ317_001056 [Molorchus minor]|uniref:Uncharacterized protein n=1 Tax=Molorchus minor TaxID=1323400 RepID=A0ABQ9JRP4_9CUCU|nr:hypothetical protein NQ317_001056 [Molorchus minor]